MFFRVEDPPMLIVKLSIFPPQATKFRSWQCEFVNLTVLQQFLNHIQRHLLGDTSTRTLLAVSGGLDSMVMLHLYHTAGFEVGVAHCNFQLRGKAADDDAMLVKETCAALNIPFYLSAFNTAEHALAQGLSIQMAARELRYTWFEQLLEQHHYQYLATAHHLNDSIETVLLSWIHGGSLEAFRGIPVKIIVSSGPCCLLPANRSLSMHWPATWFGGRI